MRRLSLWMVLAALAVTTEYRFGTIRTTFQAVPNRTSALLAKTVVVALLALVIGELAAFGILIRHSAGAISLLLIYSMMVENLVPLIPTVGADIQRWMPFNVVEKFLSGDGASRALAEAGPPLSTSALSSGWALAYFAGSSWVLLNASSPGRRRVARVARPVWG